MNKSPAKTDRADLSSWPKRIIRIGMSSFFVGETRISSSKSGPACPAMRNAPPERFARGEYDFYGGLDETRVCRYISSE